MAELERVLLTGDVHGNTMWLTGHVLRQAKRYGCQLVLQLGDFGIWPGRGGERFLDVVDREAAKARIPVWFIDGNHEDFDQLLALPLYASGLRPVRERIMHIPRGHRWSWGGREILACGGAASIDVDLRVPGRTWWPQEAITDDDVQRCVAGGAADILLSHDIQAELPLTDPHEDLAALGSFVFQRMHDNRMRLQAIAEAVRPALQIHGHWHMPYERVFVRGVDGAKVRIVSLNCDSSAAIELGRHCAVLDLERLQAEVASAPVVID